MPLWRNGTTDQSRKGEAGLPGTFSLSLLAWRQPSFVLNQRWWLVWPRSSSYCARCCAQLCILPLPLQEALRHDKSNLLQKELHSKEQELEKILYRQKKVVGSKSFPTKHIPLCCLSAQAFSGGKWGSAAEGLALDNLALASEVLSCVWRCWNGLSNNRFVFRCNAVLWMFCSCIFLSALCSLGTIFLSIVQCWQGRWGKNLKVMSFKLFVVCKEDVYGIKEPDFSSFFILTTPKWPRVNSSVSLWEVGTYCILTFEHLMTYWLISHVNNQSTSFPLACYLWHGHLYGNWCLKNWDVTLTETNHGRYLQDAADWGYPTWISSCDVDETALLWNHQLIIQQLEKLAQQRCHQEGYWEWDRGCVLPAAQIFDVPQFWSPLIPLCPSWVWRYRVLILLRKWKLCLRKRNQESLDF